MRSEGQPQPPSSELEIKNAEQNLGKVSIEQLSGELEELLIQEKISEAEIPALFDQINKKILSEAGEVPEDELLKQLRERKLELFGQILERMNATTGDRGNFEVLEKATKIITTEGKSASGGDPDRPYFDTKTQKIYMGPEATRILTNPEVLIALLAAKGSSGAANDLHHEFIHSQQVKEAQTSKAKLLEALNIFGDKNLLLKEVHALIGADRKGNGKRIEINELQKELSSDSYGLISTEEDVRRLDSAATGIKQLYALGLSDEAIGKLVSESRWDKKAGTYDTLAAEVERTRQNRSLSDNEVDDLVKVDELNTRLRIEKTRISAREVIADFLK